MELNHYLNYYFDDITINAVAYKISQNEENSSAYGQLAGI